ncbi:hypothetical protein J0S82_008345 [Galemys pyrenaicus]|uniref:Uncharacterized protein n=1 Tax=Galemys pyrenaicus TaxID=202257 RepID=A0A8J5ZN91_GALPY|nr:hypothetical protein J0S82_008345 [Galemys pyrenaicus]
MEILSKNLQLLHFLDKEDMAGFWKLKMMILKITSHSWRNWISI